MRIETTRFGVLELEESVFIHFPWGIPGFEEIKRYVLLEHRQGPFQWLQAVDDPEIAFIVCPPEVFGLRYKAPVEKREAIGAKGDEDFTVLVMVTMDRRAGRPQPHLRGPLLFNVEGRQGFQWFIDFHEVDKFVVKLEEVEKLDGGRT